VGAPPCPLCVDLVHGINCWKIIRYSDYSEILQRGPWTFVRSTRDPDFALRPLGFFEINPRSTIFAVRSKIQKIFTKRSLASEKSLKIAPKLQKFIFFNHNSKSSDSCAKILRITSSFCLCIHITHVCCILLIDCLCLLHGR
jgi:hypothetical protein